MQKTWMINKKSSMASETGKGKRIANIEIKQLQAAKRKVIKACEKHQEADGKEPGC